MTTVSSRNLVLFLWLHVPAIYGLRVLSNIDKKNAVFSLACGYGEEKLTPFVVSLRRTGYVGDIVLGMHSHIDAKTKSFLTRNNVTIRTEPCDEQLNLRAQSSSISIFELITNGSFKFPHIMQRRHHWFEQWLLHSTYDAIWLVDSSDVFFQTDPFANLRFNAQGLQFYIDWSSSNPMMHWQRGRVDTCVGHDVRENMEKAHHPDLCAGTVAGTRSSMLSLLHRWNDMVDKYSGAGQSLAGIGDRPYDYTSAVYCDVCDQYLMNVIIYQSGWSYNQLFEGLALTTNDNVEQTIHEHYNGTHLVNNDGAPFAVIHKWGENGLARQIMHRFS